MLAGAKSEIPKNSAKTAYEILSKLKMIKTLISTFPLSIILINAFGHHGGSRLKVIGGKILKSMFSNKKNWNRIIPSNFSFSESFRFGLIS